MGLAAGGEKLSVFQNKYQDMSDYQDYIEEHTPDEIVHGSLFDKSFSGFEDALTYLGIDVRYNVLAQRGEYNVKGSEWSVINDASSAEIRRLLEEHCVTVAPSSSKRKHVDYRVSREFAKDKFNALYHRRKINPFAADYLLQLPKWDGTERLETMLHDCLGAADTPLNAAVGELLVRAICARSLQTDNGDGVKFDLMPILIGEEGVGKSTFCAYLTAPKWHSESLDIAATAKEQRESLQGCVVVEISEMVGLRRADVERYKRLISATHELQSRMAYASTADSPPRRCVFIGTSNTADVIPNTGGKNRRWVPITCAVNDVPHYPSTDVQTEDDTYPNPITEHQHYGRAKVVAWLDANRDQLFAEALSLNAAYGTDLYLSRDLERSQTALNRDHVMVDVDYADLVLESAKSIDAPFTLSEIVAAMHPSMDALEIERYRNQHSRQITSILSDASYTRGTGRQRRSWIYTDRST